MRGRDQLHSLQRLDPALRLLRLRGLRAKAIDERLQVRDLPLLLGIRSLLQRERQRTLALELRVIAGVEVQLARVDVDDLPDDAVEKVAIVRDEQQRPRISREPVLQPQHGVQVEVVGRLVQQQQVRTAHQRLCEIQAHPPAAGKTRDGIAVPLFGDTQAREQRRGAGARTVAAYVVEAVVQFCERFAAMCGVAFRGGQCGLDLAQFAVAVEHEVDGRRGHRERLLRDMRDRPRRRQRDRSRVGKEFLAHGGEQARLAAAVRADQADLVPWVHGEVGAF